MRRRGRKRRNKLRVTKRAAEIQSIPSQADVLAASSESETQTRVTRSLRSRLIRWGSTVVAIGTLVFAVAQVHYARLQTERQHVSDQARAEDLLREATQLLFKYDTSGDKNLIPRVRAMVREAAQLRGSADYRDEELVGFCDFAEGQFKSAISHLKAVQTAHPDRIRPYVGTALAYRRLSQTSSAFQTLDDAIHRLPTVSTFHALKGRFLVEDRKLDAARSELETAVQLDQNDSKAHELLGIVYDRLGADGSATDALRMAIRLHRDSYEAHKRLGLMAYRDGNFERARAAFTSSDSTRHSATTLIALAATLDALGQTKEAQKAVEEARDLAEVKFIANDYVPALGAALETISPELDELCGRYLVELAKNGKDFYLDGFEVPLLRALRGTRDRNLYRQLELALSSCCIFPYYVDLPPHFQNERQFDGIKQCDGEKMIVRLAMASSEAYVFAE